MFNTSEISLLWTSPERHLPYPHLSFVFFSNLHSTGFVSRLVLFYYFSIYWLALQGVRKFVFLFYAEHFGCPFLLRNMHQTEIRLPSEYCIHMWNQVSSTFCSPLDRIHRKAIWLIHDPAMESSLHSTAHDFLPTLFRFYSSKQSFHRQTYTPFRTEEANYPYQFFISRLLTSAFNSCFFLRLSNTFIPSVILLTYIPPASKAEPISLLICQQSLHSSATSCLLIIGFASTNVFYHLCCGEE